MTGTILFMIWMLLFPVAVSSAHRIRYDGFHSCNSPLMRGFLYAGTFIIYTFVGGLLWGAR